MRFALALVLASLVGSTASAQQSVGPFSKSGYPTELPLRPLTLPAGVYRAGFDLGYGSMTASSIFGGVSATSVLVAPGVSYGVSDRLEVGASALVLGSTSSFTNEWSFATLAGLNGVYSFLDGPTVDVAGRLGLSFAPSAEALLIDLGAPVRFAFGDRLALRVGDSLVQFSSDGDFALTLPLTLQAQLLAQLGLELSTQVVTVTEGWDGWEANAPQSFGLGVVATPMRDLDLRLATSLPMPGTNSGSTVAVTGGASFRF